MKIIDEKGKLFGKINLIDFLVILFLLCILPVFYFGHKIMTRDVGIAEPAKEFVTIEANCRFIKLKPEVLNLISVGDKELDENEKVIGEIIRVGESKPYQYQIDIGREQEIVIEGGAPLKQLQAKVRLKAELKQNNLYYKDLPIKPDSSLEFKTDKYSATVALFEEIEIVEEKTVDLFVILKDLDEDTLKQVSVGDKEVDETGKTIAEILSLGKIESSSLELNLGSGNFVNVEDSRKKQISTKMRLICQIKDNNQVYFRGQEIRHNRPFVFKTDEYEVMGLPTEALKEEIEIEIEIVEEKTVDLFVILKELDEDTLKQVSVGDKEVDETGKTIAEILSLGKIESSSLELNLGSGNFVNVEDSRKKQISTKMRLICQIKDNNQVYFRGQEIRHNRPFVFKTDEYETEGVLSKAFEVISPLKERWISLQLKLTGVVPEIAKIVQNEDVERDPSGTVVAKINLVISNKPSQVLSLRKDEFITLNHPFNKDILLSLDVKCTEKDGTYYFKNYPVKMGNSLAFTTDLYSVSGAIFGMEMK